MAKFESLGVVRQKRAMDTGAHELAYWVYMHSAKLTKDNQSCARFHSIACKARLTGEGIDSFVS